MAFDIQGPTLQAAIGDDGEHVVARLPAELGVAAPQCDRIWAQFYGNLVLGGAELAQWRTELQALRAGWAQRRRAELIRDRGVRAADPAVVDRIVTPMLAGDRTLAICDELIAVCDDALSAGVGLRCTGD